MRALLLAVLAVAGLPTACQARSPAPATAPRSGETRDPAAEGQRAADRRYTVGAAADGVVRFRTAANTVRGRDDFPDRG